MNKLQQCLLLFILLMVEDYIHILPIPLFLSSLLAESASQDSGQEYQIPTVPISLKLV